MFGVLFEFCFSLEVLGFFIWDEQFFESVTQWKVFIQKGNFLVKLVFSRVQKESIPKISSKFAKVKFSSKSGKNAFLIAFSIEKMKKLGTTIKIQN
jgi:hypothetical protein